MNATLRVSRQLELGIRTPLAQASRSSPGAGNASPEARHYFVAQPQHQSIRKNMRRSASCLWRAIRAVVMGSGHPLRGYRNLAAGSVFSLNVASW